MDVVLLSLSALLVSGLAAGAAGAAHEGRRELEAADNEVWQAPAPTRMSFSTLIKALYRLNALGVPEELEADVEYSPPSLETDGEDLTLEPSAVTPAEEDDYPWQPSTAPHLVEDIPDVLPLPFETDKSNKFTHSFRFGYGVPV